MNKPYITLRVFITELIGWVMMLASLIISIVRACTIEGEIPINYNSAGEVTKYGSSAIMVFLPASMFFTVGIISLVMHLFPSTSWNVPVKITPENSLRVYEKTSFFLALLILESALFSLIYVVFYFVGEKMIVIDVIAYSAAAIITIIVMVVRIYMTK